MLGPSMVFDKAATFLRCRTCAAVTCPKANSSTYEPYIEAKKTAKQIDESSDTYDTIDWLLKHVANHNR